MAVVELGTGRKVRIFECLHFYELIVCFISLDSSLNAPGSILHYNFRFAVFIYTKEAQYFVQSCVATMYCLQK